MAGQNELSFPHDSWLDSSSYLCRSLKDKDAYPTVNVSDSYIISDVLIYCY